MITLSFDLLQGGVMLALKCEMFDTTSVALNGSVLTA